MCRVPWAATVALMVACAGAFTTSAAWSMEVLSQEELRTRMGGYDPLGECSKKPKTDLCDPERGATGCYLNSNTNKWHNEFPNLITKWCQDGTPDQACADQDPQQGMECCRRIFVFATQSDCYSGTPESTQFDECNHLKKILRQCGHA